MDRKKTKDKDKIQVHQEEPEQSVETEIEPLDSRIKELEEALAAKEAECATNWDKFVRERADMDNFRKRTQREKEEIQKYGNESLILEILPAVDNIERALSHFDGNDQDPVILGVKMTLDMLLSSLKRFGVTPSSSEVGTTFDPAIHQAMGQIESDNQPANTIVEVFQKGYLLNERLLRPAMVMVAK